MAKDSDITGDAQIMTIEPSEALSAMERAQIDMLISTARAYPRNVAACKDQAIAMATMDRETAEECFYTLKRKKHGGGEAIIDGPSIRCAEIVLSCWGNLRGGSRVLGNDGKQVTGQAFCHDLEKNVFIAKEAQRRITNREGRTYSEDMIIVTGQAAASVALREAVFKVIPKAIIKQVYNAARAAAAGETGTMKERWSRVLRKFEPMGVDEARLLAFLNRDALEQVTPDNLATLTGVWNAIREEQTTVEEQFQPVKIKKPRATRGKGKGKGKGKAAAKPAPKDEPPAQDPPAGDGAGDDPPDMLPRDMALPIVKKMESEMPKGPIHRARRFVGVKDELDADDLDEGTLNRLIWAYKKELGE